MNARKVAAQFVAYVWLENLSKGAISQRDLSRFARRNWKTFLPAAQEGMGRLLLRIASQRPGERGKHKGERLGGRRAIALA